MYFIPADFGQRDDVVRIEAGGIELRGERLVVGDRDGGVVHDPFADARDLLAVPRACGNGVETPVDEHAEARFAPPCHACIALRRRFGVLHRGDGMMRRLHVWFAAFQLRRRNGGHG